MNVSIIPSAKPIRMVFTGNHVCLPDEGRAAIDSFWEKQIRSGRNYRRGEVFSVNSCFDSGSHLEITADLSDYAHYIYTVNHDLSPWSCRVVHTSVLVESADDFLIFGKMANQTSAPGRLQCAGGGIDMSDLKEGVCGIRENAFSELYEEMGIEKGGFDIKDECEERYIKTGGQYNFIGAMYKVKVNEPAMYIKDAFDRHIASLLALDELPEFSSLEFVKKSKSSIGEFISEHEEIMVDYLPTLLRQQVEQ